MPLHGGALTRVRSCRLTEKHGPTEKPVMARDVEDREVIVAIIGGL
jgi:hypothetical protein